MKKTLIVLIGIVLLILGGMVFLNKETILTSLNSKSSNNNQEQTVKEPEEVTTTASLIMVGDNLIHSSVYRDAKRLAGGNGYDFKPIIEYIKEKTQGYI